MKLRVILKRNDRNLFFVKLNWMEYINFFEYYVFMYNEVCDLCFFNFGFFFKVYFLECWGLVSLKDKILG